MTRYLIVIAAIAVLAASCGGQKGETAGAGSEWPAGLTVNVKPADGRINPGEKADLVLENSTSKVWEVAWTVKDACKGRLIRKKDEPMTARYLGVPAPKECSEEITVTVSGGGESFSKVVTLTTAAAGDIPDLVLAPKDSGDWYVVNDFDTAMEPKEIECKRLVWRTVEDDEGKRKKVQEPQTELVDGITTNRLGGHFNPWGYEFGICKFVDVPDGEETKPLALEYYLPQLNSYCGYADHFKTGEDCLSKPFDLSDYSTITFKLKSGDGAAHWPLFEIVGWSEFADAHQGAWEASGPLEAPADRWKRYELDIMSLIKDPNVIDPREIKSVGFRVNQSGKLLGGEKVINGNQGLILIDDLALIRKPAS